MQKAYVAELLERKHLKAAAGAVRALELQEAFPQAEPLHRAATARQLLGRGRWSIAAEWAAEDAPLQLEARPCLFVCYISRLPVDPLRARNILYFYPTARRIHLEGPAIVHLLRL